MNEFYLKDCRNKHHITIFGETPRLSLRLMVGSETCALMIFHVHMDRFSHALLVPPISSVKNVCVIVLN